MGTGGLISGPEAISRILTESADFRCAFLSPFTPSVVDVRCRGAPGSLPESGAAHRPHIARNSFDIDLRQQSRPRASRGWCRAAPLLPQPVSDHVPARHNFAGQVPGGDEDCGCGDGVVLSADPSAPAMSLAGAPEALRNARSLGNRADSVRWGDATRPGGLRAGPHQGTCPQLGTDVGRVPFPAVRSGAECRTVRSGGPARGNRAARS